MKVYNLEQFALEQIYRPYQTMLGFGFDEKLKRLPYSLEKTVELLKEKSEWSSLVLSRIKGIGVTFPEYIKHELVDLVINFRKE